MIGWRIVICLLQIYRGMCPSEDLACLINISPSDEWKRKMEEMKMVSAYNSFRITCHLPLKKHVCLSVHSSVINLMKRVHYSTVKMVIHGLIHLLREKRWAKLMPSNYVIRFLTLTSNWMKVQAQRLDMIFAKCHNQSLLLWSKMSWLLRMK